MAEHLTPVRRQIVVPVAPSVAFEAFTDDTGEWWPVARHSVHGEGSTVSFVNGQLVEVSPDGPSVWGTVLDWDPPRRFRMTWHAGTDPADATEVCVRFDEVGSHTLVTLEHTGWERRADAFAARSGYAGGWVGVLDAFSTRAAASAVGATDDDPVWLALSHTPGPDVPDDVFADPRLRDHFAFVSTLKIEGVLVGAGPMEGQKGQGMTIVRTTPDAVASYVHRAQTDDRAVTAGLFDVDIAVWNVQLS
jgi:uncharacterized protein YndB with AHSA1/START domain/uncharacterized protein YciI